MAEAYLNLTYKLEVSHHEMRIIGLALAGKLRSREDLADARQLNTRLLNAQKHRLAEHLYVVECALAAADPSTNAVSEKMAAEDAS